MSTADEIAKLHELLTRGAITPAEFEAAKARLLGGDSANGTALRSFRLSSRERWIAGVCGGIEAATRVEAWIWRLLFVLGAVFTGGALAILYLLLWIFVPREPESL
jgi:phage shock protein PspC (stress-responsive transcriptional regulator)